MSKFESERSPIEKGRDFVVAALAFVLGCGLLLVVLVGIAWVTGDRDQARTVFYGVLAFSAICLVVMGTVFVLGTGQVLGVRTMQATTYANHAMVQADDRVELARLGLQGYKIAESARQHDENMQLQHVKLAQRELAEQRQLPAPASNPWGGNVFGAADDDDDDDGGDVAGYLVS